MKGLTTMYGSEWKKWAMVLAAAGVLGMVTERLTQLVFIAGFSADRHYDIFKVMMLVGLFLTVYCKEQHDDDRVKAVRAKSFQIVFTIMQSMLISIAIAYVFTGELAMVPVSLVFLLSAAGLILHLLLFHFGLYFDVFWEYEDKGLIENLKNIGKNKWGILAYMLICAVMLAILIILDIQ